MVRISAIFIAVCMALIAASVGFVVYLRFGLTGAESFLIGLGVLTALAVYNAIAARSRDRAEVTDQIATLSRGSSDMARQLAEFGLKLSTMETKVDAVLDKALATAQPLAAEIEEFSTLVKRLADRVAAHEVTLANVPSAPRACRHRQLLCLADRPRQRPQRQPPPLLPPAAKRRPPRRRSR